MRIIKCLHLYIAFAFLISFNLFIYAESGDTDSAKALLAGTWNSPEWKYGFNIEGDFGYMTSWNNYYDPDDKTSKGDVVLRITQYNENGFTGIHLFYDSSQIDVVARIVDENTIELSGRREVWKMYRETAEQ